MRLVPKSWPDDKLEEVGGWAVLADYWEESGNVEEARACRKLASRQPVGRQVAWLRKLAQGPQWFSDMVQASVDSGHTRNNMSVGCGLAGMQVRHASRLQDGNYDDSFGPGWIRREKVEKRLGVLNYRYSITEAGRAALASVE
jgi:hypothetical protein